MASRSGIVVEVPLGLWSSIEFAFAEEDDTVTEVYVSFVDDGRLYPVPKNLRGFAEDYLSTWLMEPSSNGGWRRKPWVDGGFWQDQTTERLADLLAKGQARREDDLD